MQLTPLRKPTLKRKIQQLRERYKDDRMKQQQEMMDRIRGGVIGRVTFARCWYSNARGSIGIGCPLGLRLRGEGNR